MAGTLDYCLGLGYMGTKRHSEAVKKLESAKNSPEGKELKLDPALGEAYAGLAGDVLEAGRHAEAKCVP